jgi:hypothetical protein
VTRLNGKRVVTGTGMGVDPGMYTVARLDEHLGEWMYFVDQRRGE